MRKINSPKVLKCDKPTLKTPKVTAVVDGKVVLVDQDLKANDGLKATDFNISSVIEAGASDLLKPTSPISMSDLAASDTLNSQVPKVEDATAAMEIAETGDEDTTKLRN